MKTVLSVNINKVALIRNARGENIPNLIKFASDCEAFGAKGITVHPRPDERHVRFSDLHPLKKVVQTEFNIEGFPSENFLSHVMAVAPHQCTLVPDPPGVLTSNKGWNFWDNLSFLKKVITLLNDKGIRVSTFCNPVERDVEGAFEAGADRVEFYTGDYAKNFHSDRDNAIIDHFKAAKKANELGLGINAGHDLNLDNLRYYAQNIPNLAEVSIGQALITDALYYGIENTIKMYRKELI